MQGVWAKMRKLGLRGGREFAGFWRAVGLYSLGGVAVEQDGE